MKIEIKSNSNGDNLKKCEFPNSAEYTDVEPNERCLKIFINRATLGNIDKYLSGDLNNELGGVLVGDLCVNNEGKNFIQIYNFIIAKHTNSSLSRLTFTHDTWSYINDILEKNFPDQKILGWFHSHPGHTVFLSTYDVFIQQNFFNLDYMVAYVFDPTIKERGFFVWDDKKIVKADGYYVYESDEHEGSFTGLVNINDNHDLKEKNVNMNLPAKNMKHDSKNILILSLLLLTLLLMILTIYNLYDLKQKSLMREEYARDLEQLKEENIRLNERLDEFIKENEEIAKDLISNKPDTLKVR